jgi:hypothetical protein
MFILLLLLLKIVFGFILFIYVESFIVAIAKEHIRNNYINNFSEIHELYDVLT